MSRKRLFAGVIGSSMLMSAAFAEPFAPPPAIETVAPEKVGVDPARLAHLENFIKRGIDNAKTPGAVLLVARNGEVVLHEAYGNRGPEGNEAMTTDSLFRIYSMTKAIVAVAALRLVERGDLNLDGNLDSILPEFSNMRVLDRSREGDEHQTFATWETRSKISIIDLMRHTSGMGGWYFYPGIIGQMFRDAGIGGQDLTLSQAAERTSKIPLLYQPGSTFSYTESSYIILAAVLEKVTGKPIAQVVQDEVFDPLGMTNTGFEVPEAQESRLTTRIDTGRNEKWFDPVGPRAFHSGATGLISTAEDYWRFLSMIVSGGKLPDGTQYLAHLTIKSMLSNNVSDVEEGFESSREEPGLSWGKGFFVSIADAPSVFLNGQEGGMFAMFAAGGTMYTASAPNDYISVIMNPQVEYLREAVIPLTNLALQAIMDEPEEKTDQ